jgi:signal transduction histidine kinase
MQAPEPQSGTGPADLQAEADRQAVATVLDALSTFVAVLTPDARIGFVNAASLAAVGLCLDDVSGQALWQTPWWDFDEVGKAQLRLACGRAAQGATARLRLPMRSSDGRPTTADLEVVPLHDANGRVRQLVASAVAVGTHGSAEGGLLVRDRRKDEFLAMLAHELRSPLAPLRNAAALMRLTDEGHAQRSAISELVDRQVRHLSRLLDDLLDASRIDQGKIALTLEPVELCSLLAQALESTRAMTQARGQHVVLSTPSGQVWMNADPVRLTQIIENLVTNAAKFTDADGTICITLTATRHEASLSVADNGQGIEAELLPRVFDLFTQGARSLDRSQGGLGIGLSLVRNLTLLHGGSVTAASAGSGRGSEFVVTLPLLSQHAPELPSARAAAPLRVKRVMVVDDNVDAAESLAELLALKGHQTKAITRSRAALELAPVFAPEVVLLDIGLPDIDGFELARLLRQMPPTRNSLLVAVTGYGQPEDRKASSAAGFDHHLVKPVSLRQIEELIDP